MVHQLYATWTVVCRTLFYAILRHLVGRMVRFWPRFMVSSGDFSQGRHATKLHGLLHSERAIHSKIARRAVQIALQHTGACATKFAHHF